MNLLYGKPVTDIIYQNILNRSNLDTKKLAIILIGENSASEIYVKNKSIALNKLGGEAVLFRLEKETTQIEVEHLIEKLNQDQSINGVILQIPIPEHLNKNKLLSLISPNKDVDGLNSYNLGNLIQNNIDKSYKPATPLAVINILSHYKIPVLGKHIVIINNSVLFGKPLAIMLSNELATVTICNHETKNLLEFMKQADIIITAVGKAGLFDNSYVKANQTIIDVGISKDVNGKLSGDFNYELIHNLDINYTPVPGGVGPVTIACLLNNLYL